jgi:N-hydroxyarylamine O-acetyltransferase
MQATGSSARRAEAALAAQGVTVDDYLARIGLSAGELGPPSAQALRVVHERHLARVPYENLEIQLGRPTTVDGAESARRIVADGRGGYCFHLNAAMALLLEALGYDVARRRGTVQGAADGPVRTSLNHLVLYVVDVPGDDGAPATWWADAGLGDGFSRPLALREGRVQDGPFAYRLEASPVYRAGWRVVQEPPGAFVVVDTDVVPPPVAELAAAHELLTTSPDSSFVTTATAQRRDPDAVDILRACTLLRIDRAGARRTVIERESEWYEALVDVFGLTLDDVSEVERRALWRRVHAQHEEWLAS